jgi:hypothetical protein
MNRQDILKLASSRGYPCLSITLPTHRTSPDNRQDTIRLRNLLRQASERITGEVDKREVAVLLQALEQLAESIDPRYNLDGLALFVSADVARAHRVAFTLPERVIVGESFFTRDLVYALNRSPRYWVLALSEQPTRLFEAVRDDLEELTKGSLFPIVHSGPGGTPGLSRRFGVNHSRYRDDHARIFCRLVDRGLGMYLSTDPLPLALVGVDRWQAFFREVTSHGEHILTTLTGSHDRTSAHELGKLVWPLMRESLAARRSAIFGELEAAVSGQRSASTLGEVWRCAQEGRGATLVVEEGYHEAAIIDERGLLRLVAAGAGAGPTALDDAVDEVIEAVLAKGGRVVFVDDGMLDAHSRIALILRY